MIDGHAHLNEIEDIDQALVRAKSVGIKGIVAVGMDIDSNMKTLLLAGRFPLFVHPCIGYHPWSVTPEGIDENLAFIEANIGSALAVGEVGLDYGAKAKKKVQQDVFEKILAIAVKHDKPVIIHSRYSHQRTFSMTRDAGIRRAVFHWYSGPADVLEGILESGRFISVTPALAYSPPHQEAARLAPIEQILIETDSPVVYQGKKSEPADLTVTIGELSRIKGILPEEVARITAANTELFYGLENKGQ
jgi:TatD DNase family protein